MNKKKLLLVSIVASVVLVVGVFATLFFREKPTIIMELAIYSDVSMSGTYYFTLDDKGVLRSYYGTRWAGPLRAPLPGKFMVKVQSSTRTKLNEEEMSMMIRLLDDLGGGRIEDFSGGTRLELLYNDDVYFMLSLCHINRYFTRLLWELRKLTGMPEEF
jgi:hypothetical protein